MVDRFIIKPDGKREAVYARSFDEVRLRSEKQEFELEIIQSAKSLEKRWFELFFSNPVFGSPEPPFCCDRKLRASMNRPIAKSNPAKSVIVVSSMLMISWED